MNTNNHTIDLNALGEVLLQKVTSVCLNRADLRIKGRDLIIPIETTTAGTVPLLVIDTEEPTRLNASIRNILNLDKNSAVLRLDTAIKRILTHKSAFTSLEGDTSDLEAMTRDLWYQMARATAGELANANGAWEFVRFVCLQHVSHLLKRGPRLEIDHRDGEVFLHFLKDVPAGATIGDYLGAATDLVDAFRLLVLLNNLAVEDLVPAGACGTCGPLRLKKPEESNCAEAVTPAEGLIL